MRYACRTDANQPEIIGFLRKTGHRVWILKPPAPADLLVWRIGGSNFALLETKTRTGRPTDLQVEFFAASEGCPRAYVRSAEEAYEFVRRVC